MRECGRDEKIREEKKRKKEKKKKKSHLVCEINITRVRKQADDLLIAPTAFDNSFPETGSNLRQAESPSKRRPIIGATVTSRFESVPSHRLGGEASQAKLKVTNLDNSSFCSYL